jgi:hypothetical protein
MGIESNLHVITMNYISTKSRTYENFHSPDYQGADLPKDFFGTLPGQGLQVIRQRGEFSNGEQAGGVANHDTTA